MIYKYVYTNLNENYSFVYGSKIAQYNIFLVGSRQSGLRWLANFECKTCYAENKIIFSVFKTATKIKPHMLIEKNFFDININFKITFDLSI